MEVKGRVGKKNVGKRHSKGGKRKEEGRVGKRNIPERF